MCSWLITSRQRSCEKVPSPQTWDIPGQGPLPCQWHLVAITGDLFKPVHLRTPMAIEAYMGSSSRQCASYFLFYYLIRIWKYFETLRHILNCLLIGTHNLLFTYFSLPNIKNYMFLGSKYLTISALSKLMIFNEWLTWHSAKFISKSHSRHDLIDVNSTRNVMHIFSFFILVMWLKFQKGVSLTTLERSPFK